MSIFKGFWIWTGDELPRRNCFARFIRRFNYSGGHAKMKITADSRYSLYINGEYVGFGPVRGWPNHWRYDEYDIAPYLNRGENTVAVLVNHYGEGNFQYNLAPQGLLAQIELANETIVTDKTWFAAACREYTELTPRISVQEAFEEQYDANFNDGWREPGYDYSEWAHALQLRQAEDGFHNNMEDRHIPFLTQEPIAPQRFVEAVTVESTPYVFSFAVRQFVDNDRSSERRVFHAYGATKVYAPEDCQLKLEFVHHFELNGPFGEEYCNLPDVIQLKQGWNDLIFNYSGQRHQLETALVFRGPEGLIFSCDGTENAPAWAFVGPFGLTEKQIVVGQECMDETCIIVNPEYPTAQMGLDFFKNNDVSAAIGKDYFHPLDDTVIPKVNVMARSYTDRVIGEAKVDNPENFLTGGWTTVYPSEDGDVRICLDYGKERIGFQTFEIVAPEGTIVDAHNFEFIQQNGLRNYAEGMNNSFRYVCREGRQEYRTLLRRGFQYTYLTLRNMTGPVKLRNVLVINSTYPQMRRGSFFCSDELLNKIWEVGAHTLQICSEDTYTDCPTYEQTNWVGDARNEALIDWTINGDPRLWFRCLEQTGDSLERSCITESHVPSAWTNILPAWSFLWMRSCKEYVEYTGDMVGAEKLLAYVDRCVDGIESKLNEQGLFEIRAWNMFDWADMDTPSAGAVVTHNNCFAVLALKDSAKLANVLGREDLSARYLTMAAGIKDAINKYMWVEEKQAYTDCLKGGVPSEVFSQQTHTVACMSGVAEGDREKICRDIIYNPPEDFVVSGSPFFEFFLLEAYQQDGRVDDFIHTIRRDWGFMVLADCSTFWEQWSQQLPNGRVTRSHCHGWSAAPTFFLTTYVLGIKPGGFGFTPIVIEPHIGNLSYCGGKMPLPNGEVIEMYCKRRGTALDVDIIAPNNAQLKINVPADSTVTVNGKAIKP